ncbi:MAG: hypothetical protein KA250_08110 [Verrucomicrobiales bacterium]|jgi:uncharacterized membrane protein (Fun14 family)|nr:hypothetical protein [Verrucomicrobiales bacterium]MBP9225716.1 hypothetical protein [Verrucomicrobiales bacterium]
MTGIRGILSLFAGSKLKLAIAGVVLILGGICWTGGNFDMTRASSEHLSDTFRTGLSDTSGQNPFGETAIRIGVSFLVAMFFASLLRFAVKTAIFVLVAGGLVVWFLSSQGIITPVWDDYYRSVSDGRDWMTQHILVVGNIIRDHLPSTSAAAVGFVAGLRR